MKFHMIITIFKQRYLYQLSFFLSRGFQYLVFIQFCVPMLVTFFINITLYILSPFLRWFERLTMTVILLNCVTLGMFQPCEDSVCNTQRCKLLKVISAMVICIYIYIYIITVFYIIIILKNDLQNDLCFRYAIISFMPIFHWSCV